MTRIHPLWRLIALLAALLLGLALVPASVPARSRAAAQSGRRGADDENSGELRERAEAFFEQRAGKHGIPKGARARALAQAGQLPRGGPSRPGAGSSFSSPANPFTAPPAASPGYQWALVGPKPITGSGASSPWSGRVAGIAVDPSDANTIYIAAASGGVWKTTNGGSATPTWTPLTDDSLDSMAIGAVAVQPGGSGVVLAGTGEANFSGDSYYGTGIWRSPNGGSTWTKADVSDGVNAIDLTGCTTSKIVFDPAQPGTVFAGVVNPGTFAGPGSGAGCSNPGLYRSSDGGSTWTLERAGSVTDVVVDPSDATKWYLGAEGDGVYPFDDTGAIGTKLAIPASGVDRIGLAIAPTDHNTLYAAFTSASTFTFNAAGAGIWYTTDATDPSPTWTAFTTATNYRSDSGSAAFVFPWYALDLKVDRTTSSTLYVASGPDLGRFTNFGASFSRPAGSAVHADFHSLAYAGSRLWIGTDGGVYSTDDGFATAAVNRNGNLALTQFNSGASVSTGGVLSGGTQDNGSLHTGTVLDWAQLPLTCDGGWGDVSASDPADFIFTPQSGCASHYVMRDNHGTLSQAQSGINTSESGLFYAPVVSDPTSPSNLYYGRTHLWTSADRGASWTAYGSAQTYGATISAIGATNDANTVYVGTRAGHIWSTSSGSAGPWTDSTLPAYVTSIQANPTNAAIAYATVSGFGHLHVYKTTNSGGTWTAIDTTLGVDAPANDVAVDWRANHGQVYVATDVGTFVSADGGATWANATPGMPQDIAMDVLVDTSMDRLVVFTHGRGVWAAALGTNPPDTAIAGGPADSTNSTSASFTLSGLPAAGAAFQCKLDDQAFETCSATPQLTGLSEGQHTFQARAISSTGSDQTPAIRQWTVDLTPPDTGITSQPPATTTATAASFGFSSTEPSSTFRCSLDAAAPQSCSQSPTFDVTVGDHQLAVAAVDPAGNADPTPATYAWHVDAPAVAPPPTTPTTTTPTTTTTTTTPTTTTTTGGGGPIVCKLPKLKALSAKKLVKGVKVAISCAAPATVKLTLKLGKKILARGAGSVPGGVRLRGTRSALRKAVKRKLVLVAAFSATGASPTTASVHLTLKR
jgi:hypothetical protein